MRIEDILLDTYGPLLTVQQLADVLKRSTNGLRWSLRHQESMEEIRSARVRIGRRIYFRSGEIAEILENKPASEARGLTHAN